MTEFTPPYISQGLYAIESRQRIESANRATIKAIFEKKARRRKALERERRAYRNHLNGIHTYGFCPWCPANVFYD